MAENITFFSYAPEILRDPSSRKRFSTIAAEVASPLTAPAAILVAR